MVRSLNWPSDHVGLGTATLQLLPLPISTFPNPNTITASNPLISSQRLRRFQPFPPLSFSCTGSLLGFQFVIRFLLFFFPPFFSFFLWSFFFPFLSVNLAVYESPPLLRLQAGKWFSRFCITNGLLTNFYQWANFGKYQRCGPMRSNLYDSLEFTRVSFHL